MADQQEVHALLVVDVQVAFDDPVWGRRNNPACESNVRALIAGWRRRAWPVVFVRHDSCVPGSPLASDAPGNAFKSVIDGTPDLLVVKHTNSAFYGRPDLHAWMQRQGLRALTVCGITTNHCCETTARMAGNLGYETTFVIDATHTFDRRDLDGNWVSADQLARVTAANLNGEFADVLTTREVLASRCGGDTRESAARPFDEAAR
jgi:nicotinamidase-related amidase